MINHFDDHHMMTKKVCCKLIDLYICYQSDFIVLLSDSVQCFLRVFIFVLFIFILYYSTVCLYCYLLNAFVVYDSCHQEKKKMKDQYCAVNQQNIEYTVRHI